MATTGRIQVAPGQTVASSWGNLVWDQSVQQFASAADRDNQIPSASRTPGMTVWLDDTKRLTTWTGTAWRDYAVGTSSSIVGTPGAADPPRVEAGTVVPTTDANGQFDAPYAVAFTSYVATVVATLGDSTGATGSPGNLWLMYGQHTLSKFHGVVSAVGGGPFASQLCRINYVAVGF